MNTTLLNRWGWVGQWNGISANDETNELSTTWGTNSLKCVPKTGQGRRPVGYLLLDDYLLTLRRRECNNN